MEAVDRLPVKTLTGLRAGTLLPRINGSTDQSTSYISDTSAKRNTIPTGQWKRQDLQKEASYSTRRQASDLHTSGAIPTDRRVGHATLRKERRTPPAPLLGLSGAALWGAHARSCFILRAYALF